MKKACLSILFIISVVFCHAQIKVQSNGYIGLGTITPTTNLEIKMPQVLFTSSTSTANLRIQYYNNAWVMLEPTINSSGYIPVAGDVSIYNGEIFCRNNMVICIYTEGSFIRYKNYLAKEIDALLLKQEILSSHELLQPRVVIDSMGHNKILPL